LKNQKQLHPRRKLKKNLAKVKDENANAEAPKIDWKNNYVHGLISLHGNMEPEFIKNDKKQDNLFTKKIILLHLVISLCFFILPLYTLKKLGTLPSSWDFWALNLGPSSSHYVAH
jgi:hypothetical protein